MLEVLAGAALAFVALFLGIKFFTVPEKETPPAFPDLPPDILPEDILPEVYGFFTTSRSPYPWRGQVLLDMGYQVHGCDSGGRPTGVYGARSPSGRPLTYEWRIETNGTPDSVFSHAGRLLTRPISNRLAVWFPGWKNQYPPYPVSVNPLSCPIMDSPTGTPKEATFPVTITVTVRDDKGNEVTYRETGRVTDGSC